MPKITVKPHEEMCPEGKTFEATSGTSICDALLSQHIHIEHACEKSCACTTCHVYVRAGMDSMDEATELEEDFLDRAWGVEPDSRLSCQSIIEEEDLTIEIPKYTINMVSEAHH